MNITCLSYWYPIIQQIKEIKTPQTLIVLTDLHLWELLDGNMPEGYGEFVGEIVKCADSIGYPCFLRTGLFSSKHRWRKTCYIEKREDIPHHVYSIIEDSNMVDLLGLDTNVWAIRKFLPTKPIFFAFGGMPVTEEYRFFVREGKVEHFQPYWPPVSLEDARHIDPLPHNWRSELKKISLIEPLDLAYLSSLTELVGERLGGYWSVDWLKTENGWYLTDMAEGDKSYKWEPLKHPKFIKRENNEIIDDKRTD